MRDGVATKSKSIRRTGSDEVCDESIQTDGTAFAVPSVCVIRTASFLKSSELFSFLRFSHRVRRRARRPLGCNIYNSGRLATNPLLLRTAIAARPSPRRFGVTIPLFASPRRLAQSIFSAFYLSKRPNAAPKSRLFLAYHLFLPRLFVASRATHMPCSAEMS